MSNIPAELKYLTSHEWVLDTGDGNVTIGITDHAQELLGDLVFVDLPEVGQALEKGNDCAVLESVKAASDVYSPVSGEVIDVNEALADTPEIINTDPYGEGWIFRMKLTDSSELDDLLDADEYQQKLAEEAE